MRWFRANARFGGRLALFALALQLALSFGHVHREDIFGPSSAASAAAALPAADTSSPASSDQPSKHSDDYCAICATISLLGGSFVATPPQLPVPLVSHAAEPTDGIVAILVAPRRAAFQSRAPPVA